MTTAMTLSYPMSCDIKLKVMTSVFDLSMFRTNWRSFDLTMTENVTSDEFYDHNNDFFVSMSGEISNERL